MIKIKTVDKNGENPYTLEIRTLEELANCKAHQKVLKQIREKLHGNPQSLTMEEKLLMNYMIFVDGHVESSWLHFDKWFTDFWQNKIVRKR